MMDLEFLRGLIDAVENSEVDSLEITRAGTRIRINKTPPPAPVQPSASPANPPTSPTSPTNPAGQVHTPAETGAGAPPMAGEEEEADSGLVEITSPMVGTFYRAPAPEAPPYVEVGSRVTSGQTLCILEAMKLMNELESEVEGVVREVLVENAEPVEYGQVLFRVDPAGS